MTTRDIHYSILTILLLHLLALAPTNALADKYKANNNTVLMEAASWTGGLAPLYDEFGVWDSTVTGPMTNSLGWDLTWGGIKIINPGGPVTLTSGNTLTLNGVPVSGIGIDMSSATQDLGINCGLSVAADQSWNVASGRTLTVGGAVDGSGFLTKTGPGVLVLNGVNPHSGATTVSAGTLLVNGANVSSSGGVLAGATLGGNGSLGGNVTVSPGGTLEPGGKMATGTFTVGNTLYLVGGGNLNFDLAPWFAGPHDLLSVGNLSLAGLTTVNFNWIAGAPPLGWPYTIISYTGTLTGGPANLVAGPCRFTATFADTGNAIQVVFSGTPANLLWDGVFLGLPNANWNIATTANWYNSIAGTSDVYYNTDPVMFDDSAAGPTSVNVVTDVRPNAFLFDNTTKPYTFSGAKISGYVGLSKKGSNKVIFLNNNDYVGGTTLEAGTLQLGNGGTTGWVAGNLSLSNSASVVFNRLDPVTFNGVIGGAGSVVQAGPGTLTLTAANTYTGSTVVSNGALLVNGSLPSTSSVTVKTNATLGGNGLIGGPVTVQAGATLAPVIWELALGRVATMSISNTLSLEGTTAMVLNQAARTNDQVRGMTTLTYGGTLVVTNLAGTLAAGDSFKLFDAAHYAGSFAAISPATPPGIGIVWDMSYLPVNGTLVVVSSLGDKYKANNNLPLNQATSWTNHVAPGGSDFAVWDSTVAAANTTNSLGADLYWGGIRILNPGGPVTLSSGNTLTLLGVSSTGIDMSGASQDLTLNCGVTLAASQTWTVVTNRTQTVSGAITGTSPLTKSGFGTLTLSGNNTFSGALTISAGSLWIKHSNALGAGPKTVACNNGTLGHCQLHLDGNVTLPSGISFLVSNWADPGTVFNEGGNNVINGSFTVTSGGGGLIFLANAGSLTLNGTISANTSGRGVVFDGSANSVANGIIYDGAGGAMLLLKTGNGITTLNAANTYTGTTEVRSGTLVVNGSLAAASAVTVKTNATLGGIGLIRGPVTVQAGATLSPGIGIPWPPHTLTVNNTLTLAAGSTTIMQLNKSDGTNDQVYGITTVTYGGTLVVTNLAGTLAAGDSFKLFDGPFIDPTNFVSGSFAAISPATPGIGIEWDMTYLPVDGTLRVVAAAGDKYKANNTLPLNQAASWTNHVAPGASDFAVWDATVAAANLTNELGGDMTWGGIKIINPGGPVTLVSTSNTLTLNGVSGVGIDMSAATVDLTIKCSLSVNSGVVSFIDPTNFIAVPGPVSGNGGLTMTGGGLLSLSGSNTYTGPTTVSNGTLQLVATASNTVAGVCSALGTNTLSLAGIPIVGPGAQVQLLADSNTTFRSGRVAGTNVALTLIAAPVTAGVSNQTLTFAGGGLNLSNAIITVPNNGQILALGTITSSGPLQLGGDGRTHFDGGITYEAPSSYPVDFVGASVGDPGLIDRGDWNSTNSDTCGMITGNGGLNKGGTGVLELWAANSYTGPTLVSNGVLVVSGSLAAGSPVTIKNNGLLGGNGIIGGPVTVEAGGRLMPGVGGIGTLTVNNTLTLAGTMVMELNKAAGTNDQVRGITTLTYGGYLNLTNLGPVLQAGDSFKLFDAGHYSGSFAAISPATPGIGIVWDMSYLPVDGTLRVATAPSLVWSGAVNGNWDVGTTLNWTCDGSPATYTDGAAVSFDHISSFFDVWLELTVQPSSVTVNNSVANYTFTGPGKLTGPTGLTKNGAGILTLGNANTYTGATTVNAGTLLVDGSLGGGGSVIVAAGATLGGAGIITGPVTVQTNATLSPGIGIGWIGRLAISNSLSLSGTTAMDLNKAAGTNDQVYGLTTVTYGGTLVVTNLAGTLAAGDSFKLFDGPFIDPTNRVSGRFAAISPAIPGIGIGWDMSYLPVDGTLRVAAVPVEPPQIQITCTNGSLELTWPAGCTLQSAPSVSGPWTSEPGATSPCCVVPSAPMKFYRLVFGQ